VTAATRDNNMHDMVAFNHVNSRKMHYTEVSFCLNLCTIFSNGVCYWSQHSTNRALLLLAATPFPDHHKSI